VPAPNLFPVLLFMAAFCRRSGDCFLAEPTLSPAKEPPLHQKFNSRQDNAQRGLPFSPLIERSGR
jgi:hypothetical protein